MISLLVLGALVASFLLFPDDDARLRWRAGSWGKLSFSGEEWRRCSGVDPTLSNDDQDKRGRMLQDLLARHRLLGKSAFEIVELLGPADEVHGSEMWYFIGNHNRAIDPDVLVLSLRDTIVDELYVRSL